MAHLFTTSDPRTPGTRYFDPYWAEDYLLVRFITTVHPLTGTPVDLALIRFDDGSEEWRPADPDALTTWGETR